MKLAYRSFNARAVAIVCVALIAPEMLSCRRRRSSLHPWRAALVRRMRAEWCRSNWTA